MQSPPQLTDRTSLRRNRARAMQSADPALFLQEEAAVEIKERLGLVNKTFTNPAIVTGFPEFWGNVIPEARIVEDLDTLDLQENAHDLVIHAMSLHWANDPVGQMVQCRRALKPDGFFLAVLFGGQTLAELRASLAEAEVEISGGLSPRVAPMGEIRDLGALLQRAGFALPVADSILQKVSYKSTTALMHDLRIMGEANALATRPKTPIKRALFRRVEDVYKQNFGEGSGIIATFELIFLTGWAPDESQQKPLRPGSATARLADALDSTEMPLADPARPRRV